MDPREEFQSLTLEAKATIEVVAITLAAQLNRLDPKLKVKSRSLLYKALDAFVKAHTSGQKICDLKRFLIASMIRFSNDLTDSCMQQFAFGRAGLTRFEHDVHVRNIIELLKKEIVARDHQAEMVWKLMLEGYSGPEIERMCGLTIRQVDTIKKRIRRRSRTFLMKIFCQRRDNA